LGRDENKYGVDRPSRCDGPEYTGMRKCWDRPPFLVVRRSICVEFFMNFGFRQQTIAIRSWINENLGKDACLLSQPVQGDQAG
jgi:hypothetical protein